MENAAEALMMGFAVLIFVIALTVGITVFSQVMGVADSVLYTQDETNYYDYQGAVGKASQNRIVGLETIVPTLYKYYSENFTILFREGSYNEETGEFSNLKMLSIYETPSNQKNWGKNYETLINNKYSSYLPNGFALDTSNKDKIFSFDSNEEILRHEPWTGSQDKVKQNIDCFLYGDKYYNPNNNEEYIDYSKSPLGYGGFIGQYKDKKFVETVGEYTYSTDSKSDTEDGSSINKKKEKKRIVIFTLINNS